MPPPGDRTAAVRSLAGRVAGFRQGASFRRTLGARARRHAVFVAIAAAGALLRVLVIVAYPPAIMYLGDSAAYLDQAWNGPWPGDWRPSGYPMFLLLIDGHAHLTRLVIVQHLLTFLAGAALYAVALHTVRTAWIAACVAAPVLLSPWVLDLGQFVLADSLFGTLVAGGVVLLARPGRPAVRACAAAGLLLGTAVTIRTVGYGPLAVGAVALLAMTARTRGHHTDTGDRVGRGGGGLARLVAFVLAAAVPIIGYSAWSVANGGTFSVSAHSGFFLYGRMAPFADCGVLSGPELRTLCDPRPVARRTQPDMYLWPDDSPLRQGNDSIPAGREELAGRFAAEVIRAQPVMVATTTAAYLIGYFSPVQHENARTSRAATWELPTELANVLPAQNPHAADGHYVLTEISRPLAGKLTAYSRLGYLSMPLVGAGLLAGAVAASAGVRRGRTRPGPVGSGPVGNGSAGGGLAGLGRMFWLASGAGLSVLVLAALTAGFDYRYLGSVIGLLGAAAVLGWTALARALMPLLRLSSSALPSVPGSGSAEATVPTEASRAGSG
ncbi:hypothetical protein [Protofrankia symbiont of Coriaria myrtifolia]|uniref:hypothetical protein n=1 Tax=Protofrankia symbiont of Coriaria myrtifolia TaxID=1306540 RepID=UPI001041B083|nr:hypothetical protein [Protofrankia symbiont of Coriaria myrtifolia]